MKRCPTCGEEKEESEFGKNKGKKDGLRWQCKACRNAHLRAKYQRDEAYRNANKAMCAIWRKNNPEKKAAGTRKWAEENREAVRASQRAYAERNPEKRKANRDKWRRNNPEKAIESRNKWRRNNPEKVRATDASWRANNPEKEVRYLAKYTLRKTLGFPAPIELVEAKAQQYLLNKLIKELKK